MYFLWTLVHFTFQWQVGWSDFSCWESSFTIKVLYSFKSFFILSSIKSANCSTFPRKSPVRFLLLSTLPDSFWCHSRLTNWLMLPRCIAWNQHNGLIAFTTPEGARSSSAYVFLCSYFVLFLSFSLRFVALADEHRDDSEELPSCSCRSLRWLGRRLLLWCG